VFIFIFFEQSNQKHSITVVKGATVNERWQPLFNNLGHACRKNKKYFEAIAFHEQALTIVPGCGATYSTLGLCFALIGEIERAMDAFHASLAKRPDDSFATTMLKYLVEELAEKASIAGEFSSIFDAVPNTSVFITFYRHTRVSFSKVVEYYTS
jgi:tetratricopeptide (TPR) repeat protein